ncbi:MAG TPA: DUF2336 domain-containing protein [Acetobacteraceae bacterium]|nr:DUF2336 domain-containing protein [Acetobacteraceae bacterium]
MSRPPQQPQRLQDADEATRVRLGASQATPPETLRQLAADASATVRAALAMNPAAPAQANHLLAHDADERVRTLLARKLASLAPHLSCDAQAALQLHAHETLLALVHDEAVRVRAAIADAVKEMPDAPRSVILQLAQDASVMVSEPVIRLSPLLGTEDLLALLSGAPPPAMLLAVSRRQGIEAAVSDAIAASADSAAIQALLSNPSAHIREATLDALIARAVGHADWHEPLVRRPALSARSARALSEIVATHLLEVLAARSDLPARLAEELRVRLAARLAPLPAMLPPPDDQLTEDALTRARNTAAQGELTEAMLLQAAQRGDARLVSALLAVATSLPISVIDRAATLRSAKGLVSLTWKAGFTMRCATALQMMLARLAPDAILSAGPAGGFPLAVEEMRWQLDFLERMGR